MSVLAASIPPDRFDALAAGMELQAGMHPHAPHWYLPWIGVRPEAQGMGLGAQLLSLGLARADAEGMPAYLEATNRRNAALYARHGFEPIGVVEAPGYPEIIPMWRPARAGDPRFQSALALWLADDEETALPELAALAAGGNRAAQVLLARIDVTLSLQGPWLVGLPRAERNALLRAPGGLSGRSWMQAAAEDTPLAQLWLVQLTPAATAETALAFAAMGEHRAARETLWSLSGRNYRGFAAMADDPNYPPDMRYLIWREWADDPATRARAEAEIAALHPGDPQLAHFDSRPIDPGAFDDWLASASLAALLRAPCEAACPDSVRSCTRAAYRAVPPVPAPWRCSSAATTASSRRARRPRRSSHPSSGMRARVVAPRSCGNPSPAPTMRKSSLRGSPPRTPALPRRWPNRLHTFPRRIPYAVRITPILAPSPHHALDPVEGARRQRPRQQPVGVGRRRIVEPPAPRPG